MNSKPAFALCLMTFCQNGITPPWLIPLKSNQLFNPRSLGKSNSKIRGRICELLFRLVQTDNPTKVKRLCEAEIEWLLCEYEKASTRTSYVSAYRKAVRAFYEEHGIANPFKVEKQTSKGQVINHLAESYLLAPAEDYERVRQASKAKTEAQRDNLIGFNATSALEATTAALQSEDWRELAVGLMMAVQSRPSEILQSGEFKAISQYRLAFSSRAKKRGEIAQGEIYCLVDTVTFIDAFSRLRREPGVMTMKDWSLKEIDSGKNKTLNRAVRRLFGADRAGGEIIPVPYGEQKAYGGLSCKNLRAAGVNVAYWLHGREDQSLGRFAERQLLHNNPGTAANYEDFYCTDTKGKRLQQIGILKDEPLTATPLSEKRSSLSLDKQLLSMVSDAEQWGEGSHADRLERIIARAKQADRLEAQLARECEKRQRLELELNRLQSLSTAPTKPISAEPIREDDQTGFNWRDVSNDELNGDRRHDAYHEKLRRSVEAIQEYNAGLDDSEQFAITGSLLRQLTKVKPGLVKEWMEAHEAELTRYNAGYGARQNTSTIASAALSH